MLIDQRYFETLKNQCFVEDFDDFERPKTFLRIEKNVAVLRIHGVIVESMASAPWWDLGSFCGCDVLIQDLKRIQQNTEIDTLILDLNTPGGEVDGVVNVADFIYDLRERMETIAIVNSIAASAGYWFARACERIGLVSETATVGSIGVAVAHIDISQALEQQGVRVTHITAGKFKRITARELPLSEEGAKILQEQVEEIFDVFTGRLAKFKGVGVEQILPVADGRVFIGKTAIDNELADGFVDYKKIIGVKPMSNILDIFKLQEEDDKKKKPPFAEEDKEGPEAQDEEEDDEEMEDEEEDPEAQDEEEDPEAQDEEEDDEEMEDEEEDPEAQDGAPCDKDKKKINKKNVSAVRLGVKLERQRVSSLIKLGLTGKKLSTAVASGNDVKTVAFDLMLGGEAPTKTKGKKKRRKTTIGEGYLVGDNIAPTKSKKKQQADSDLEAVKAGAENYVEFRRR